MFESLESILPREILKYHEPMKEHTTFRVGGEAQLFIEPCSKEQVKASLQHCIQKGYPFTVIGAGSNLLVSDDGYEGVIIKIGSKMRNIRIEKNCIYAEAGISLSELARKAAQASLTGLEFAEGIPGKLGGGIFMNAGAYGGEMNDLVGNIYTLDLTTGEEVCIKNTKNCIFEYRSSYFQKHPYAILGADLELAPGNADESIQRMKDLWQKRKISQPLNFPSAGSTFKRPSEPGKYAGALIEQAGLKGYTCGGAQVSSKHAGFIINYNHATASDIYKLIQEVQKIVYQHSNIWLEPEVRFLGDF